MLTEPHLKDNENIDIPGFKWIGQNKLKTKRASGGQGFNYDILSAFNVDVLDIKFEGIIALQFSHKKSQLSFMIIGIYLPPKNNSYGYITQKNILIIYHAC